MCHNIQSVHFPTRLFKYFWFNVTLTTGLYYLHYKCTHTLLQEQPHPLCVYKDCILGKECFLKRSD